MMLAGIGPVKLFLATRLITKSNACRRTEATAHAQPRAKNSPHRREPGRAWGRTGT
jgi:hypothetical protein